MSPDPRRIANGIISAAVAICAIDALYSLVHGHILQFRVGAILVLLLVPTYWLRPALRANFAVTLVGLVAALFAVEFLITLTAPLMIARYAWKSGQKFDFRTREEVIRDLRKTGAEAYQRVAAGFPIAGPGMTLGGSISNSTIVYCNESGQWTIFPSDQHGFNNPKEVWNAPLQIAAVGDSFTNGACSPRQGFHESHTEKVSGDFEFRLRRQRTPCGVGGDG